MAFCQTQADADGVSVANVPLQGAGGFNGTTYDRITATGKALDVNLKTALSADIDSVSTEGKKATYAGGGSFNPGNVALTDVFALQGSASKTIKVRKVRLSGINGTGGSAITAIVEARRTTAPTGTGTITVTKGAVDSTNAASGAGTCVVYSAPPTVGTTLQAIFANAKLLIPLAGAAGESVEWTFGVANEQPPTIRGTSEYFVINVTVAVLSGSPSFTITVEWTEE